MYPDDPTMREFVEKADLVIGREELLSPWERVASLQLKGDLREIIREAERVRAGGGKVVFLVSGDPNFFGIASLIREMLGKEKVATHPAVSSMQMAFSRIGESWHDARFFSAHGRPLGEILEGLRTCRKACVLTSDGKQPSYIAQAMLLNHLRGFHVYLCEDLGGPEEKVEKMSLEELSSRECHPLNLLLFLREEIAEGGEPEGSVLLGIPDEEFSTPPGRSGRMTKRELRAVAISRLMLSPDDLLWDVGAGCGAVSVEASRLLFRGKVFALEEDDEDVEIIKSNIRRFGATNVFPVKGVAPDDFPRLPSPDAVFIGGSSGRLEEIIRCAAERLRGGGRMVCNLIGLERVLAAKRCMEDAGLLCEASLHLVMKLKRLGKADFLDPHNPVFVVSGRKPFE